MFRRVVQKVNFARLGAKRTMGSHGHHDPPVPTGNGLNARGRRIFPHDYQWAMIIMSFYGTLIGGILLKRKFSAKEVKPAVTHAAPAHAHASKTDSTDRPSIESDEFSAWLDKPGNIDKLIEEMQSVK